MNQAMINKLKKMQREMEETQESINKTEFSEEYQGVKVSMLGTREVTRVEILDQSLTEDKDILEELLQIAFNSCLKKIDKEFERAMAPYTSLMGGFGF